MKHYKEITAYHVIFETDLKKLDDRVNNLISNCLCEPVGGLRITDDGFYQTLIEYEWFSEEEFNK